MLASPALRRIAIAAPAVLAIALLIGLSQSDSHNGTAARNSLMLAGAAAAIALPLATMLALLLVRTDAPGRGLAAPLLLALLLVPLYLQAAAWDAGFGKLGWYTAASGSLADPLLINWRAAIWIHAMAALPWATLIVAVGLQLVEPALEEEALLDGSAWSVFLRVTLPRALAAVGVAALWVMVSTAGEMTVTNIYLIPNFAELLYTGYAVGDDASQATVRVLPGIVMTSALVAAALVAVSRLVPPADRAPLVRPIVFRLGRWRWPAGLAMLAVVLLIAGVPLANLCYEAGMEVRSEGGERIRQWSSAKLLAIVGGAPQNFREEFGWATLIGAITATAAVLIAAPLAWWARRGGIAAWPALITAALLVAVPGPLIGMAVNWPRTLPAPLAALDHVWLYDQTVFAPTTAITLRCLPLTVFILWYALRSIPADVLDAAKAEGAGAATRLLRIALPQRAVALAMAWLASLALATGDLTASILTVPPGVSTLPIRIFGMIHFGITDQVAGVCLVAAAGYLLIASVLAGALFRVVR